MFKYHSVKQVSAFFFLQIIISLPVFGKNSETH